MRTLSFPTPLFLLGLVLIVLVGAKPVSAIVDASWKDQIYGGASVWDTTYGDPITSSKHLARIVNCQVDEVEYDYEFKHAISDRVQLDPTFHGFLESDDEIWHQDFLYMNLDAWGVERGARYTLSTYTRIDVWGRIGRKTTHGHWQANENLSFWHKKEE